MAINPRIAQAMMQDPRMAMALRNQQVGASTAPVASPLAGIARALQGGLGGFQQGRLANEYTANDAAQQAAMLNTMYPNAPTEGMGPMPENPERKRIEQAMQAGIIAPQDLKSVILSEMTPKEYGYETVNGTLVRTDPRGGPATPVYEGEPEKSSVRRDWEQSVADGTYDGSFMDYQKELKAAGRSTTNINVGPQTPGQEAADKEFGKEYATYKAGGGYADMQKQISQLRAVSDALGKSDDLTGPMLGSMPEWMRSITNPKSADAQQLVEEVVQRNLRQILGAQFTEKEGERLIARAYNPRLDEQTNKKRVDRLIRQMEEAAAAKESAMQYFEQNGSLRGWEGKLWTPQDFDLGEDQGDGKTGRPPADADLDTLLEYYGNQ